MTGEIRNVTVIGAGPLGRSLAGMCCRAGFFTTLEDVLPSNIRSAQAELSRPGAELPVTLRFASTVAEAVRDADLVLDTVPDELESKLEIFSMVDRMAPPRTIMMTPTAIHSIADLASCTYRAERCFSFVMPDDFAIALEGESQREIRVIATRETAPDVLAKVREFWARAGWRAVLVVDPAATPAPTLR